MRRREFIAVMGGAAAWPLVAQAQQQAKRLIGFLTPEPRRGVLADLSAAFLDRLGQLGYREHENFEMEARYADGNAQRLPGLAQELAALHPDVILAHNTSSAVALKHATSSIPIVVAFVIDPVEGSSRAKRGPVATSRVFSSLRPSRSAPTRGVMCRRVWTRTTTCSFAASRATAASKSRPCAMALVKVVFCPRRRPRPKVWSTVWRSASARVRPRTLRACGKSTRWRARRQTDHRVRCLRGARPRASVRSRSYPSKPRGTRIAFASITTVSVRPEADAGLHSHVYIRTSALFLATDVSAAIDTDVVSLRR